MPSFLLNYISATLQTKFPSYVTRHLQIYVNEVLFLLYSLNCFYSLHFMDRILIWLLYWLKIVERKNFHLWPNQNSVLHKNIFKKKKNPLLTIIKCFKMFYLVGFKNSTWKILIKFNKNAKHCLNKFLLCIFKWI